MKLAGKSEGQTAKDFEEQASKCLCPRSLVFCIIPRDGVLWRMQSAPAGMSVISDQHDALLGRWIYLFACFRESVCGKVATA